MKAIVDSGILLSELEKVSAIVKSSTVIPILTCAKMEFNKDHVVVSVSDLETMGQSKIPCAAKAAFTVVMEFADLKDVCKKVPSQPLTFDGSGKTITIVGDNVKFSFAKFGSSEEFPKVPEDSFDIEFNADKEFFASLVCANICRNPNQAITTMSTACIDVLKESVVIVGTDSLLMYRKTLPIKANGIAKMLVPSQFVETTKTFKDAKISAGQKFIKAEYEKLTIISRLIDSPYVDYASIFRSEIKYNWKADRKELIFKLGAASITSSKTTKFCQFNFDKNSVKITSSDVDYGNDSSIDLITSSDVEIEAIGFNAGQMTKLLNLAESHVIEMSITDPKRSIFIKAEGDESVIMLLQPLAIL